MSDSWRRAPDEATAELMAQGTDTPAPSTESGPPTQQPASLEADARTQQLASLEAEPRTESGPPTQVAGPMPSSEPTALAAPGVEPSPPAAPGARVEPVPLPRAGSLPRTPPSPRQVPEPGRTLVGRYTVLQPLGEGGMGVVLAAYDARLDRRVALKLLHQRQARAGDELETRLLREAQAMARLNHPNVVSVYDSGNLEDGTLFLAMEYVEGQTLNRWCKQRQRPWREVLGAFLEAGQGLAAAHAAGLIHRDFKPDNVLVGRDGRVRVTDFGVARAEGLNVSLPATPLTLSDSWETPLTLPGRLVGTPRYMAPEVLRGRPADARSDLFCFSVALYEALFGQLPFPGTTAEERARSKLAGRLVAAPDKTDVPAWVTRALLQGLSAEPDKRPPSLHALLETLRHDPLRRRRARLRTAALACGAAALTGLAVWSVVRQQGPGCSGLQRRLAGVWDEPVRERVRQALLDTGLSYAPDTASRVETVLDGYASSWVAMSTEVCEAGGGRAQGARGLTVLREACLERRRGQLGALTELLARGPDAALLPKAVQAAQALSPLDYCADDKALLAVVPPPEDPALRARVEQLQRQVDRLQALHEAGKYSEGVAQGEAVVAQARQVDFAPLRARALYQLARLKEGAGDYKAAEAHLGEAARLAAQGGDAVQASEALSLLVMVVGKRQSRLQEALGLELALETVVALAHDERAQALAHNSLGNVLEELGRYEEALERHQRARALREKALGPEHPEVAITLNNLGMVLRALGRYEETHALWQRVLTLRQKVLGSEHPSVAVSHNNLGAVLQDMGRYEDSLAEHQKALALWEKVLGPEHPNVALSLSNQGLLLRMLGRYEEARGLLERAMALRQKLLGPEHLDVATTVFILGAVHQDLGRYEEARTHYEKALAMREKVLGPEHPLVAATLQNLGLVHQSLGRSAEALAMLRRSRTLREKALGPEHPEVGHSLTNIGYVLHDLGRFEEAREYYEKSRALSEKALGPEHPEMATPLNNLGAVLHEMGRYQESLAFYQRAMELTQKALGSEHHHVAYPLEGLGRAQVKLGAWEEASRHLGRALALRQKVLGAEHPELSGALLGLGELELARRRPAQAVALLERAMKAPRSGQAEAQLALARALWESGEDRKRAVQLATQAHAYWQKLGHPKRTEAAQWLAAHPAP